jgi:hypothetical protein
MHREPTMTIGHLAAHANVNVERLRAVEQRLAEAAAFRAELMRWLAACDANPLRDGCPALAGIDRAAFTSP